MVMLEVLHVTPTLTATEYSMKWMMTLTATDGLMIKTTALDYITLTKSIVTEMEWVINATAVLYTIIQVRKIWTSMAMVTPVTTIPTAMAYQINMITALNITTLNKKTKIVMA
jgi:hypothetical protein